LPLSLAAYKAEFNTFFPVRFHPDRSPVRVYAIFNGIRANPRPALIGEDRRPPITGICETPPIIFDYILSRKL